MTKERDYVKGNSIIAKYMGGIQVGSFTTQLGTLDKPNIVHDHYLYDMGKNRTMNECYWADTTMKYHKDWNWLIPVLIKIRKECPILTIDETDKENAFLWDLFKLTVFTPIETVWDFVIMYIKYSNKHFN